MRNRPQWDRAVWWAEQWKLAYHARAQGGIIHRPSAAICSTHFWNITCGWPRTDRLEALLQTWPDCPDDQQRVVFRRPEAQPCP